MFDIWPHIDNIPILLFKVSAMFLSMYYCKNIMCVPRLYKIVLNMRLGLKGLNSNYLNEAFNDLMLITLQKPLIIFSKKSIATFGLRVGIPVSLKVTLRHKLMYNFMGKFRDISLPRVKGFLGFKKSSFDMFGNFSYGVFDHSIFFEIFNGIKKSSVKGFDICFYIKNKSRIDSYRLMSLFGFPFIDD